MSFDVSDFHLLRPLWLLAVVPAILVAVQVARGRGSRSRWRSAIEPALLAVLLDSPDDERRRWLGVLLGAGLTVAVLALAGPTFERLPQPVEQRTDALVIVFDLSLSMYVEDVEPSRLVRARHKITDVLRRRDEGFTALVAYAGDAHTVTPLTDDTRTIENLLGALNPAMMPVLGSNPGEAVARAHQLFDNAGINQGRILLVTDGIYDIGDVTERAEARFPLSILGVGTRDGGPIPLDFAEQPGRYLTDNQGVRIVPRLDVERLETVAELSYGRYASLAIGDADIAHLLDTRLPGDDATRAVDREFDVWADAGFWLILPLIPLALMSFRRGVVAVALLAVLPLPADASWWDDLWERPDQQGYQALENGQPERAAQLFDDGAWRGVAQYRGEAYERAAESFAAGGDADAYYNAGNALAFAGRYQDAIDAYDQALALEPGHEDARYNRELLDRLRRQRQQQGSGSNDRPGDSGNAPQRRNRGPSESNAGSDRGHETGTGQERPAEAPATDDRPGAAQAGRERADADRSERDAYQAALEQWLRRVPDDPGGLLRRKFQHETNQRMRQGEYARREQERIW